ncbi:MAG: DNA polymerase [Clostridia bacterium]
MKKFVIIDGNSLLYRAFFALPLLSNDGEYCNAIYGFSTMLIKVITSTNPDYIAVAFDKNKKNFRHEIFNEYKATRNVTPTELVGQFKLARNLLDAMKIKWIEQDGIEGDDIIGTLSKFNDVQKIIVSGDKDVLQLINDSTIVWLNKVGISNIEVLDKKTLFAEYERTPQMIIEEKALIGDKSDNIPGVKGIGKVSCSKLLEKYKNIENIYKNIEEIAGSLKEKLIEGKQGAYLSHQLATIKTDCKLDIKLEDCKLTFPFDKDVKSFFEKYNFKSLLKREELFIKNAEEKTIKNNFVTEIEMLKKILKNVTSKFAFTIVPKFQFAIDEQYNYEIQSQQNMFGEGLSIQQAIDAIMPILNNGSIKKTTKNLKDQLVACSQIPDDVFDLVIADYLVSNGNSERLNPSQFFSRRKELEIIMGDGKLKNIFEKIEMPLVKVLFYMEQNGFKIDGEKLNEITQEYFLKREQLENEIYLYAGKKLNINSSLQVSKLLFEDLQLGKYLNSKVKKNTGVEVLLLLENKHPIISPIMHYRKLQKLISSYLNPFQTLLETQGNILHTVFNQTLTTTGRLSSSEPNLQNIPTRDDEGKLIRKIFVSRFECGVLISADYNQIELKLLAVLSNDPILINAFKNKEDIHTQTACQIFGKPANKITSSERRSAKIINFGIIYGMSEFGLSQNLGISVYEAKKMIQSYFEKYQGVKLYMDKCVEDAKKNGYVETYFGRVRNVPEVNSLNYQTRNFGNRIAMNTPLQGTASDIIKMAMILVQNELTRNGLCAKLILTIHDELIVDTPALEVEKVKQILKENMENVVQLSVPLTVELSTGKTWFDCK